MNVATKEQAERRKAAGGIADDAGHITRAEEQFAEAELIAGRKWASPGDRAVACGRKYFALAFNPITFLAEKQKCPLKYGKRMPAR